MRKSQLSLFVANSTLVDGGVVVLNVRARCGGNAGLEQTSHENCIVRRAMVDEQVASGRFHIQRGLSRLGFGKQREPGKAIKLKNIKL